MPTYYGALHYTVAALSLVGLLIWIRLGIRARQPAIVILAVVWLGNTLAFSIARLCGFDLDLQTLNVWSLAIRLQSLVILTGAGIYMSIWSSRRA